MFLLDTNVVSELRRVRPHGAVLAWLATIPNDDLYLSAITIGEIQSGIELVRRRDSDKADEIEKWLETILVAFEVLAVDAQASRRWAKLMHGVADQLWRDAMIAASADVLGLTIVTRDLKDFAKFGVPLLNPFQAP